MEEYKKNSLSLAGAVGLGTGVMIGAGIFALLGQVAALAGEWFPYVFIVGAVISAFSAYSYIKVSNTYPSAGGIGMILKKAYGTTTITGGAALLMAITMVIAESLVARTFGSYTLQLFQTKHPGIWEAALGVGLLVLAYIINTTGNKVIGRSAQAMAILKIAGIAIFAIGGLIAADIALSDLLPKASAIAEHSVVEYVASLALTILAYKGFTTITNSGGEIKEPHKNVGRAIIISLLICVALYFLVAITVAGNLSVDQIIEAKDHSLAEAARPAYGNAGLYFTVAIAIIATISGVIASLFAVSRMTAMLTEMKLIPHNHFGMSGPVQKHMLVYVVVLAVSLTILFDLTRIASIGAILYLVMDMIVHWGVFRHLRKDVKAKGSIVISALVLDFLVLAAFVWVKIQSDILVVIVAAVMIALVFAGEKWFLSKSDARDVENPEEVR